MTFKEPQASEYVAPTFEFHENLNLYIYIGLFIIRNGRVQGRNRDSKRA